MSRQVRQTRPTGKQAWPVEEYRLRPVYQCIQNGDFNQANEINEKWFTTQAGGTKTQPFLAIRLFLTQKLRKGATAVFEVYADLEATGPFNSRTLWWVAQAFKGIHRHDLIVGLYEKAWDAEPASTELGDELFLAAAAAGNTEVMASSSRKLFNKSMKPDSARQAAFSAWAHNAPSPSDADPFPLAPKDSLLPASLMLRASKAEITTADELWLHLQIAIGSNDLTEAWRLVQTESRCGALARRWYGMEAAKAIGKRANGGKVDGVSVWADEIDNASSLLRSDKESQHNYAFYKHIFFCFEQDPSAELAARLNGLFLELHAAIGSIERAPLLAVLELDDILRRLKIDGAMDEEEWKKTLAEYFDRFGSKESTTEELDGVVSEDRVELARTIVSRALVDFTDERGLRARTVAEYYLLSQKPKDWKPTVDDARAYWRLYLDGLQYGKGLPKTDRQPADTMGMIAAWVLLQIWQNNPDDEMPLLHAAACLEYIVSKSPAAFPARYHLVWIYRLLRAPAMYAPHVEKLGLTEIQLDNLFHVLSEHGALEARIGGTAKVWQGHANRAMFMYERSIADLPEHIKQALQHGSFSKVHGIRTLRNCLADSIAARTLEVELLELAIATGTEADEGVTASLEAALAKDTPFIDNRDEMMGPGINSRISVDEKWIRTIGPVMVQATRYLSGQPAAELPAVDLSKGSSSAPDCDRLHCVAVDKMVKRARALSSDAQSSAELEEWDGEVLKDSIAQVLDAPNRPCTLRATITLGQLARTVDAVYKRFSDVTKPNKGKRTAAQTAFLADLQRARESLKPLVDKIVSASGVERIGDWSKAGIGAGFMDDVAFLTALGRKFDSARSEQLTSGLKKLLSQKQL